jgi:hypothetical protein
VLGIHDEMVGTKVLGNHDRVTHTQNDVLDERQFLTEDETQEKVSFNLERLMQ